ncbi:MAG: flagellar protein [Lachnospiraceae bacterium]|nr:flagellar protein [Lachnospiraceae bacterium]
MNVNQTEYTSIEQIRSRLQAGRPVNTADGRESKAAQTFGDILTDKTSQIKFSKHASQRLETRQIDMSEEQKARLQDAAGQAREKGMKESLVMVDNLAFIVNVKSNTVITAVNDTSHAVFTNIDGAIIN